MKDAQSTTVSRDWPVYSYFAALMLFSTPFWTLPSLRRSHWIAIAALLPPVILYTTWLGMKIAGNAIPEADIGITGVAAPLALFIIPAVLEELGWSCFALAAFQQRMTALRASLLIGAVWAA